MNRFKTLAAAISAIGVMAVAAPAFAAPSLTFTDGANTYTVDPFSGFDWQSNATAVATAPVFDGTTVMTTTYLASAEQIKLVGGTNFAPAPDGSNFEFTVKATIFETAVCVVPVGPTCASALFTAVGGSFEIFYDSTPDADIVAGSGFLNGTKVLAGTILPGIAGAFTLTNGGLGGTGSFSFDGAVSFTETDNTKDAYFFPALGATNATATLQFGTTATSWTPPTSWVDGGGIPANALIFQADGNQAFAAAPEPASLALVGLSLAGLALARRRSAKK